VQEMFSHRRRSADKMSEKAMALVQIQAGRRHLVSGCVRFSVDLATWFATKDLLVEAGTPGTLPNQPPRFNPREPCKPIASEIGQLAPEGQPLQFTVNHSIWHDGKNFETLLCDHFMRLRSRLPALQSYQRCVWARESSVRTKIGN